MGASIIPSMGMKTEPNKSTMGRGILYVGGSGPGNYTTIQDAIDNASDGDTVFVYNGTYYENVVIEKTINLTGEDRNTTIIDGSESGDVVFIDYDTDWVNISGFTIRNSGNDSWYAGIDVGTNFNTISDNTISNNSNGIFLDGFNNTISRNIIKSNSYEGISIETGNNLITDNNILDNGCGIYIFHNNNNISFNNISNNGCGITGWTIFYNFIFGNIISSNNGEGIDLENAYYTTISCNTISSNLGSGIDFETCRNNIVTGNTVTNNEYGLHFWFGTTNNIVTNNSIISNDNIGIRLYGGDNCNIYGNTVSNNGEGIRLEEMLNCNIYDNAISSNNGCGIYLDFDSDNNVIYHNNLINNTPNAYDYECTSTWYNNTLQEGNYYDDYNGTDADGDGIGDTPYNISGGSNKDLYPLMFPFEWYSILQIILENSEVNEGVVFNVTVKSKADITIPEAIVEFNDESKLTNSSGKVTFTAPEVVTHTEYEITAIKEGYTGDSKTILVKDVPDEFKTTFIFGRIDNLTTVGDVITFEALNVRFIKFSPFQFLAFTSGELITISKDYLGFVGARFIFALCGADI